MRKLPKEEGFLIRSAGLNSQLFVLACKSYRCVNSAPDSLLFPTKDMENSYHGLRYGCSLKADIQVWTGRGGFVV